MYLITRNFAIDIPYFGLVGCLWLLLVAVEAKHELNERQLSKKI